MTTETRTLTTTDGDTIDEICHRHYGATTGVTETVIAANPHLLNYPPRLPAGLTITLPAITAEPQRHRRLW
ncbi:phage tail protein [Opitutaceae bacterium TAV4]|nr:phage tail protein [Opitutaceae bacterium TAV4]RRK00813.1 phage tail protein [Opitutaceae bacterium TAV3]